MEPPIPIRTPNIIGFIFVLGTRNKVNVRSILPPMIKYSSFPSLSVKNPTKVLSRSAPIINRLVRNPAYDAS